MAMAFASGLLLGLAPAWRASGARASIVAAGSLGGRGSGESPRLRLGRALLVCQMALSLALVFAALLFVQSLRRLEGVAPGFDTRNLVLFRVNPALNGYEPPRVLRYGRVSTGSAACRDRACVDHYASVDRQFLGELDRLHEVAGWDGKTALAYRMSVGDDFFTTMVFRSARGGRSSRGIRGRPVRGGDQRDPLARRIRPERSPRRQVPFEQAARRAEMGCRYRRGCARIARCGASSPRSRIRSHRIPRPGLTIYVRTTAADAARGR